MYAAIKRWVGERPSPAKSRDSSARILSHATPASWTARNTSASDCTNFEWTTQPPFTSSRLYCRSSARFNGNKDDVHGVWSPGHWLGLQTSCLISERDSLRWYDNVRVATTLNAWKTSRGSGTGRPEPLQCVISCSSSERPSSSGWKPYCTRICPAWLFSEAALALHRKKNPGRLTVSGIHGRPAVVLLMTRLHSGSAAMISASRRSKRRGFAKTRYCVTPGTPKERVTPGVRCRTTNFGSCSVRVRQSLRRTSGALDWSSVCWSIRGMCDLMTWTALDCPLSVSTRRRSHRADILPKWSADMGTSSGQFAMVWTTNARAYRQPTTPCASISSGQNSSFGIRRNSAQRDARSTHACVPFRLVAMVIPSQSPSLRLVRSSSSSTSSAAPPTHDSSPQSSAVSRPKSLPTNALRARRPSRSLNRKWHTSAFPLTAAKLSLASASIFRAERAACQILKFFTSPFIRCSALSTQPPMTHSPCGNRMGPDGNTSCEVKPSQCRIHDAPSYTAATWTQRFTTCTGR
eukprot:gene22593-biopygen22923